MSNRSPTKGELFIAEMKEFGTFHKRTQRYIRQSLDVAYNRGDPVLRWGRTEAERANIRTQMHNYNLLLDRIRQRIGRANGVSLGHIEFVLGPLGALTTFDLSMGCLPGFGSYRFLYERLFGALSRPWLPGAYVASGTMPVIDATHRSNLLRAISEQAACADQWSTNDPMFIPEWVDKVDMNPPFEQKPPPRLPPPDPKPPKENA